MMKLMVIASVAVLAAVAAAQGVIHFGQASAAAPAAEAAPMVAVAAISPQSGATGHSGQIAKSADGHFWAQANVNGHQVRFLVDTGATAVSLSPDDARRLGFSPSSLDYGYKVMTAHGEARAARISLRSVSVAGARVADVDAYVIESGLDTSLLGMSYLGRLDRFEATRDALILRP